MGIVFRPFQAIVRRLSPLVIHSPDYFRDAVIRWATNPPEYAAGIRTTDPPEYDHEGILPIPLPVVTTPDERIALLAAIHDACVHGPGKIDPWRDPSKMELPAAPGGGTIPGAHTFALRYGILVSNRVPELQRHWVSHEQIIEKYIAEVEGAIAIRRPNMVTSATTKTPRRRGRRKADYDTVEREAKLYADWQRAKATGQRKVTFAKDHNLTLKDLDCLLDRVSRRKGASE